MKNFTEPNTLLILFPSIRKNTLFTLSRTKSNMFSNIFCDCAFIFSFLILFKSLSIYCQERINSILKKSKAPHQTYSILKRIQIFRKQYYRHSSTKFSFNTNSTHTLTIYTESNLAHNVVIKKHTWISNHPTQSPLPYNPTSKQWHSQKYSLYSISYFTKKWQS